MVAPGQVRAGKAYVELGTDDKLPAGLKKASRRLKAFGAQVGAIGARLAKVGAVVAGAMFAAGKVFAKMGDDVAKMAKRTGFSVEALSELQYVASQSGTSIDALENALRRMQRTIYDAERGLSTAVDGLADLGLTLKDLTGLTPEQQFRTLAEAISRIEDPTRRAGIAMTLFGRSGTAMLPMMAKGAAGIEELQRKARKLGLTITKEDAAAAEVFTDELDTLWKVMKMGVFRVGATLVPLLSDLAEKIQKTVVAVMDWLKNNRELVITIVKLALKVGVAGVALMAIGKTIGLVGAAMGLLAIATKAAAAAMTLLIAHPVIAGLAAIGIAAGVITYALTRAKKAAAELKEGLLDTQLKWRQDRSEKFRARGKASVRQLEAFWAKKDATSERELQWMKKIRQLKLQAIEDERTRTMISIQERYAAELRQADLTANEIGLIDEAMRREMLTARRRFDKQEADEALKALEDRRGRERSTEHEIARLRIQIRTRGKEQELALLKLEHKRQLAEAERLGHNLHGIRIKQELELQLLGGRDGIANAVRGTFLAVGGHLQALLVGGGAADRTAVATERTAKNTDRLVRQGEGGGATFT